MKSTYTFKSEYDYSSIPANYSFATGNDAVVITTFKPENGWALT